MAPRERKAILCCALRSALGDRRGSNPRHPAPQASALPTELRPPCVPSAIIHERHNSITLLQPQKICRRRSRLVRSGGNFAGSTSPSTCEADTSGTRDQKIAGPLALRCHLRRAGSRFELRSWPPGDVVGRATRGAAGTSRRRMRRSPARRRWLGPGRQQTRPCGSSRVHGSTRGCRRVPGARHFWPVH